MSTSTAVMPSSNRNNEKISHCQSLTIERNSTTSAGGSCHVTGLASNPIITDFKMEMNSTPCSPTHSEELSTAGDDISSTETSGINSTSKSEQVKSLLIRGIDEKTRKKISGILCDVSSLSDIEKLLLYMQMPTASGDASQLSSFASEELTSSGGHAPLTPGGSSSSSCRLRSPAGSVSGKKAEVEVAQTYAWIKTHLEEDAAFSLPKQEVYDDYKSFCQASKFDALCVADFGKAMKQVFPAVKPRRLGQRGNSKYCYSGLKKRFLVETNPIPSLDLTATSVSSDESSLERFLSSVSSQDILNMIRQEKTTSEGHHFFPSESANSSNGSSVDQPLRTLFDMILKWAESISSQKFSSIRDFLFHLLKQQTSPSSGCPTVTSLVNGSTASKTIFSTQNQRTHVGLNRSNSISSGYQVPSSPAALNYPSQNLEKLASNSFISGMTQPFQNQASLSRTSRSRSVVEASLGMKQEFIPNYLTSLSSNHDLSLNSSCDSMDLRGLMSAPPSSQSTTQKYKSIQPKRGDSTSISSAPATASSSPTQMLLRFDNNKNKRKLSAETTTTNGMNSSSGMTSSSSADVSSLRLSNREHFMIHPQKEGDNNMRKKLCLASIQSSSLLDSNALKSMTSSSGSFTSTDSGIETPGGSCATSASSASFPVTSNDSAFTSSGNLFEYSGQKGSSSGLYLFPSESNSDPSTGSFMPQGNANPTASPSSCDDQRFAFAETSDVVTESYSRGSNNVCRDLENKSNLDRHQLSQLRKLLEQNLPSSHRVTAGLLLKGSNSLQEAVSLQVCSSGSSSIMTNEEGRVEQNSGSSRITALNTTSGILHDASLYEHADSVFDTTTDSMNNHGMNRNTQTSAASSLGNRLADSPMIMSHIGSPIAHQEMHISNMEPLNQTQRYTFQPICHSSNQSPSSLLSETTFLNGSPPLTTSLMVGTTNGSNSPNSRSPPQTPFISESRSRNDSGHSFHSSFEANSSLATANGTRLDSGLSSVSGSPFVSPHGTPVPMIDNRNRSGSGPVLPQPSIHLNNRSRHSSGPGHYNHRTPVMRANSYSPLTSYPHAMEGTMTTVYRPRDVRYNGCHQLDTVHEMNVCDSKTKKNQNNRSRHYSTPFALNCNPSLEHLQVNRTSSPSLNSSVANFMRSSSVPAFEHSNNGVMRSTPLWSQTALQEQRSYPNTPTSSMTPFVDMLPSNPSIEDTTKANWDLQEQGKVRGQRNLTPMLSSLPSSSLEEDQDLQTTLDDLRDCDNDFSRFAQELEEQEDDLEVTLPSSDPDLLPQTGLGITD